VFSNFINDKYLASSIPAASIKDYLEQGCQTLDGFQDWLKSQKVDNLAQINDSYIKLALKALLAGKSSKEEAPWGSLATS
jgi:hypothetical protein